MKVVIAESVANVNIDIDENINITENTDKYNVLCLHSLPLLCVGYQFKLFK